MSRVKPSMAEPAAASNSNVRAICCGNQCVLSPAAVHTTRHAARSGLSHLADLRLGKLKGWPQTEGNAGKHCNGNTKDKHREIDLDHNFWRKRVARQQEANARENAECHRHAKPCLNAG